MFMKLLLIKKKVNGNIIALIKQEWRPAKLFNSQKSTLSLTNQILNREILVIVISSVL